MTKTQLIIVPCHSIWKSDREPQCDNYGQLPVHWFLAPFQHEGRDHLAFIMHSLMAVKKVLENPSESLLLFSGSCTKVAAGRVSEARSYYNLTHKIISAAVANVKLSEVFEGFQDIPKICGLIVESLKAQNLSVDELFEQHISTEEFALDSFDNLYYSLAKFHDIVQENASKVTIVGFEFKRKRFVNYHAAAIDFPSEQIDYLSYEPKPVSNDAKLLKRYFEDLDQQEKKNALDLFTVDWYATKDPLLKKKLQRNPFQMKPNYQLPFEIPGSIQSDTDFFQDNVQNKMPWSIPN